MAARTCFSAPARSLATEPSTSIRAVNSTETSIKSFGPRPLSTSTHSTTSSALPTARPSGASIAVTTASVRTPDAFPIETSDSARRRESASVFMNAPPPVFTSSTSASMPSAIFLLMIDALMSGMLSTVPVTSRSA